MNINNLSKSCLLYNSGSTLTVAVICAEQVQMEQLRGDPFVEEYTLSPGKEQRPVAIGNSILLVGPRGVNSRQSVLVSRSGKMCRFEREKSLNFRQNCGVCRNPGPLRKSPSPSPLFASSDFVKVKLFRRFQKN